MATTANENSTETKRSWLGFISNAFGVTLAVGLAIGLTVSGVFTLHSRAENVAATTANPPISVTTTKISWTDHYDVERNFIGRLEPARQTSVAFERGGLVTRVAVDEGDKVKRGAVIAELDTARLKANRTELLARKSELQARRSLAMATMKRQSQLKTQGWSPKQRFDEARFSVQELDAGIARVDAQISALDIDIEKSLLRAPYDGEVASRSIDEGSVVAAGTRILELLEAGNQLARIGVSPEAAAKLVVGRSYALKSGSRSMNAKLKAVRSDLETGTRTVTAVFAMSGKAEVQFGDVVSLAMERQVNTRGFWLPTTALSEGLKGLWTVLLVEKKGDGHVIRREVVEVLHVRGNEAFARGGLSTGDHIVSVGANRVTPGQRVARATSDHLKTAKRQ